MPINVPSRVPRTPPQNGRTRINVSTPSFGTSQAWAAYQAEVIRGGGDPSQYPPGYGPESVQQLGSIIDPLTGSVDGVIARVMMLQRMADAQGANPCGGSLPVTGTEFERQFQTSQGPVDFFATIGYEGNAVILHSIGIYPANGGIIQRGSAFAEVLGQRAFFRAWGQQFKSHGFDRIQFRGYRERNSSSGAGAQGKARRVKFDLRI